MRKYLVSYLKEVNDECVEREIEIECMTIFTVLDSFKHKVKVFKRVTSIKELTYGK